MQKDEAPLQQHPIKRQQSKMDDQSIVRSLSLSFSSSSNDENKIIFLSKCLDLSKSMAKELIRKFTDKNQKQIVLLVEFEDEEIQQIKYWIESLLLFEPKPENFKQTDQKSLDIKRLNDVDVQKRSNHYLTAGIYSMSSQILLTDLLRQNTLNSKHLSRIFIKINEKIADFYHQTAWISTIIKKMEYDQNSKWKTPITFISFNPYHYSFQGQLERIYRTLYCKKVVIWPFGRSEIHKSIAVVKSKRKIKEFEHKIFYSQNEQQILEILIKILNFLKQVYYESTKKQIFIDEFLYFFADDDVNKIKEELKAQKEFNIIRRFVKVLNNCSKFDLLKMIDFQIQNKQTNIWKSNNSILLDLTHKLYQQVKQEIFRISRISENTKQNQKINLYQLLINGKLESQQQSITFDAHEEKKYECFYQINYEINLIQSSNEKIHELIKVIQSKIQNISSSQVARGDSQLLQKNEKYYHKLYIYAQTKSICNYIKRELSAFQKNGQYLFFLKGILDQLGKHRPRRLSSIRKIYDKNKVQKVQPDRQSENEAQIPKKTVKRGPKKGWEDIKVENQAILQQILCNQIETLMQVITKYTWKYEIDRQGEEEFKQSQSTTISDLNDQMQKQLQFLQLKNIDYTRINLQSSITVQDDIIFKTSHPNELLHVVTMSASNYESCVTGFNQFLRIKNPESIIFYSPDTTLLRTLYIHQAENWEISNISEIRIFSIVSSHEAKGAAFHVTKEDQAFWNISKNRQSLPQFIENPNIRIKSCEIHDQYEKARLNLTRNHTFLASSTSAQDINLLNISLTATPKMIVVDSREFKSSLPSFLYHFGFTVIPKFLEIGDYILSPNVAIEKKSVHTRDLHLSLRSGRLEKQLERMNAKYSKSYLLIECQDETECRRSNFIDYGSDGRDRHFIRRRLLQLIKKYPKIRIIWSTNVRKTSQLCKLLKQISSSHNQVRQKK